MVREASAPASEVLLDCVATSHMFCNRSLFTRYKAVPPGETISVGDGDPMPVTAIGSVSLKCRLPEGVRTVVLHGVKHVPALTANLVSLGSLEREGASGSFGGGGIKVLLGGEELLRARLLGMNLYQVDLVSRDGGVAYLTSSSGSLRLWHRWLGHLNLDAVRKLASKSMVKGLTISAPSAYDHMCEGCALGKSHRLPFPWLSTTEYPLMGLVIMDLTGPMSVETWSGMSYVLVVVEVSCRFGVGRLLAAKDEAYGELVLILTWLERQSGKKCKALRSDNGTEFINDLVKRLCEKNGITHQTTIPYMPEQNGIAERAIAVYFSMVRCMLHSAGMDLRYWGEAFMYAVHIRNLSLTSGLADKVPYHAWTRRKPDVSHLRVFGSIGFANIPKKLRGGKLEATAVKCRLLGWWADESKGYRMEDLETKKVIASRDVRFIEDETPTELAVIDGGTAEAPEPHGDNDLINPSVRQPPAPTLDDPTVDVQAPKAPRWGNLPPREASNRNRKAVQWFGVEATEEEVNEALDQHVEH
jgi:transposase InsO family protein